MVEYTGHAKYAFGLEIERCKAKSYQELFKSIEICGYKCCGDSPLEENIAYIALKEKLTKGEGADNATFEAIEKCGYKCGNTALEKNIAYISLKEKAKKRETKGVSAVGW